MFFVTSKRCTSNLKFCGILLNLSLLLLFELSNGTFNNSLHFQLDVLPEKTYYIASPNYPQKYDKAYFIRWSIRSLFQIHLNCEVFDIPTSNNCQSDHVILYLSPNNAPLRLCGNGSITRDSEGHEMNITFQSNYFTRGGRFACYLQVIDAENNCTCGWKKPTRIVGGENTGINEYPMMAGMVDLINVQIFCGAVIISEKYVLSAAHCFPNRNISELGVLVGDHDISTGTEANGVLFRVADYIMHPNFISTKRNSDYDIAIITVDGNIKFTNEVGPACLPFQHNQDGFSGSIVDILGWGTTEFAGSTPNILQKAKVSVINLSKCVKTYPNIIDHQICTYREGKDSCQFDSGGPVLWQNPTTGRIVSVGIISYGISCGTELPSVNTRVGAFIDWIVSVTPDADYCKAE